MTFTQLWHLITPPYDPAEAKTVMRLVLETLFGMTMTDVYSGKVSELSADEEAILREITCRLQNNEPVQYVLGQSWFCSRRFKVAPGVLIPRPETEDLCQWIIADSEGGGRFRLLDIGTGSGCIAITLALDISGSAVEAWDLSDTALAIAADNSRLHGANVKFRKRDILDYGSFIDEHSPGAKYDVIVSNPPYVCYSERNKMDENVLGYEPHEALFVPDNDPLRFYCAIASFARAALAAGGSLYFEINPLYAAELEAMLAAKGYSNITFRSDRFGRCRMVKATRK